MEAPIQSRGTKRRVWSDEEEEALVECMEEACSKRQKCEGGNFKPGVVREFEIKLQERFPDAGLKMTPHIESAMRRLKSLHAAYTHMLNQSGFGWNPDKQIVYVADNVWQEYVKSYDKVKEARYKPFPLFERLRAIYGKDRATRTTAQTLVDVEEEVKQEDDMEAPSRSRKRRVWSGEAEEALLECMEEACSKRQKCEGGNFKPGVLRVFEIKLQERFPDADLKVKPHIESAMRRLKNLYAAYADMLNQSGFGWNPDKQCIYVEDSVWQEYVKSHDKVKELRYKPFPLFERLRAIYRKNRETDTSAQTPVNVEEEVEQDVDIEDLTRDGVRDTSSTPGAQSQSVPRPILANDDNSSRSRDLGNENAIVFRDFADKLVESMERGNKCLKEFVRVIDRNFSCEARLFEDMRNVYKELKTMDLCRANIFRAQRSILRTPADVHMFWGVPLGERKECAVFIRF